MVVGIEENEEICVIDVRKMNRMDQKTIYKQL